MDQPSRWLPVPGFDGYYISDQGDVRGKKGKILKPMWTGSKRKQYATVRFSTHPRIDRKVHVLVLETFVGPRPDGLKALHRDDDTRNNVLSNLFWGTSQENRRMTYATHSQHKLSEEAIANIRSSDLGPTALARIYNVSPQRVCDYQKGRA